MAGFDAGTVVSPLDYTLKPYVNLDGRLKEPSDRQIADFLDGMKKTIRDAQANGLEGLNDLDASDPAALMIALDNVTGDDMVALFESMARLFAELCSNVPSQAQILELPLRVRAGFYAWVQSEVVNPEPEPAATTKQPIPLRRAVGG